MRFLQTITVKYHGPTYTKPSRYSATTTGGFRKYYCKEGERFFHCQGDEEKMHHAAELLRDELEWECVPMIGGWVKGGAVFVMVPK